MRSEFSEMYQQVFREYGFDTKKMSNTEKSKIREYLRDHFKKLYGDTPWSDLPEFRQDYFIYVHIQKDMLGNYLGGKSDSQKEKVRRTINAKADASMLGASEALYNRNDVDIFKKYEVPDCTAEESEKLYGKFYNDFYTFNPKFPIPSYKDWVSGPRRIYDYLMTDQEIHPDDYDDIPLDGEIDHYIIKAIVKALEINFKIGIDVEQIEECLSQCKKYPLDDVEKIQMNIDYNPSVPDNEQREIIKNNIKTKECLSQLDNIDSFIYDVDDRDE